MVLGPRPRSQFVKYGSEQEMEIPFLEKWRQAVGIGGQGDRSDLRHSSKVLASVTKFLELDDSFIALLRPNSFVNP